MERGKMPRGDYISESVALYLPLMNRELAFRLLMKAGLQRIRDAKFERKGYWGNTLLRVSSRVDAAAAASTSVDDTGDLGFNLEVEKLNNLNAQGCPVEDEQHVGDLRNIAALGFRSENCSTISWTATRRCRTIAWGASAGKLRTSSRPSAIHPFANCATVAATSAPAWASRSMPKRRNQLKEN